MRKFSLIMLFCTMFFGAKAQQDSSSVEKGKLYFAPLPVLASNPAFGFIYGAAASGSMFLGDPAETNISNALFTATYSTKKQLMFLLKPVVYTNENKWMLIGDWRFFLSSQPTYGLGTGPRSHILSNTDIEYDESFLSDNDAGELLEFDLIRFYQTALKQVKPNFYVGLGYHLDIYNNIVDDVTDLEAEPPVVSNHFAHSIKYEFDPTSYNISGLSANIIYDTRDNLVNPYSGRYANLSFRVNPEFIGSTQNSSSLWLEYRDYFSLSKTNPRKLIAMWTYANLTTSGQLPYMGLPSIGWDLMGRSGRAFPQGRWRGDNMYYLEFEYRAPLPLIKKNPDLLGFVVFANMTTASSKDNDIDLFQYIEPALGTGLRVMIAKKARTNLTVDYGWGPNGAGALYINLNEYF